MRVRLLKGAVLTLALLGMGGALFGLFVSLLAGRLDLAVLHGAAALLGFTVAWLVSPHG